MRYPAYLDHGTHCWTQKLLQFSELFLKNTICQQYATKQLTASPVKWFVARPKHDAKVVLVVFFRLCWQCCFSYLGSVSVILVVLLHFRLDACVCK